MPVPDPRHRNNSVRPSEVSGWAGSEMSVYNALLGILLDREAATPREARDLVNVALTLAVDCGESRKCDGTRAYSKRGRKDINQVVQDARTVLARIDARDLDHATTWLARSILMSVMAFGEEHPVTVLLNNALPGIAGIEKSPGTEN